MHARRRRIPLVMAGVMTALTLATSVAAAASSDPVRGSVVIAQGAEACIQIALDGIVFGGVSGLTFTPDTGDGADNVMASSSPYTISNCSEAPSTFTARATSATDSATGATYWDPYDPFTVGGAGANICDHGVDLYRIEAVVTDTDPDSGTFLTTTDRDLNGADDVDPVPGLGSREVLNNLTMPCEGSAGSVGDTVQFEMIYTAALQ